MYKKKYYSPPPFNIWQRTNGIETSYKSHRQMFAPTRDTLHWCLKRMMAGPICLLGLLLKQMLL